MMTSGEATYFSRNINSFIALVFVGSFALGTGLIVWHSAVGDNPIADFLAQTAVVQAAVQE